MNDNLDHVTYYVASSKLAIRYYYKFGYTCKTLYYIINASGQTSVDHAKIPGNEKAHCLAKLASGLNSVFCSYQQT